MARDGKERKDKEDGKGEGGKDEDYQFVPPDFDEDAFIHKELVSFRTTSILFVWGILAALVSWLLYGPLGAGRPAWLAGMAVALAFGFALKPLYRRLKVDIKHFARREWMGTGFLFFFTWLAFFLLFVNPPISDYADPQVEIFVSPPSQAAGDPVAIDLFVEDNVRVDDFTFTLEGASGAVATRADLAKSERGKGHYVLDLPEGLAPGTYAIHASATDGKGRSSESNATFAIADEALELTLPDGGVLDGPTDIVFVESTGVERCKVRRGVAAGAYPCLRTVRLDLQSGGSVALAYDEELGGWKATSNTVGWQMGNNTFTVTAELVDRHHGSVAIPGGDLVLSDPATVEVLEPPTADPSEPKVPRDPSAPARGAPGLALPALAAGLVAAAALARRKGR